MNYAISTRSYLERAKARLSEGTPEGLFYAAFELRCFIEVRQDDYLRAQREYARSVPKAWKIGDQGKALEAIFESDRIQRVVVTFPTGEQWPLHHVPVNADLRNESERLGDLLHAQMVYHEENDGWWTDLRARLLRVYRMAWVCCQGNLTSPVFWKNNRTMGTMVIEMNQNDRDRYLPLMQVGVNHSINVKYLDKAPDDWEPDL